ncbi:threonine/serine exporter family protein [Aliiglaciecola sp. 3_MG-2023]|uniref:threonine/serine ThrE exporter family protein n=1 Tax=Aliiglaciecola sp. 3_MG-2023 TaxID=3062644 RepID=UPI0026E2EFFF|nr:threonine/serine exporter family protein [Aliiglaciecola sp. 3_MG-2023]MDO6692958.1 threonine/serine exporter family protein [Aliiglaciecola sp. 3_MG-2023]
MDKSEFIQIRRFILKLGKMLHKYGSPSFRLEAYLSEIAAYLGVNASFISTPTSLSIVLWSDRHEEEYNHAARIEPGELDMNSLSLTDELAYQLLKGEISLADADKRLDQIDAMQSPYNKTLTGIAFGTSTSAFAMLMGAGWPEIFWSGVLGLVVYFWTLWSLRSKRVNLMLESVASFTVGFAVCTINYFFESGLNIWLIILSSLIILVPGLSLTIGLAELSSRNLVSGTARVMDAIMQLFKLYFGAFIGITLGYQLYGQQELQVADTLPFWVNWLGVLLLSIGLVAIFRTRMKHVPWAVVSTFIAYGASTWSSAYLENGLGAFVGAFALGVFSNLFSRIMNAPSTIVAMHGLIVLVPGSKTYIGLNSFISGQDFIKADHIGQETFLILMSLVAGLIFANIVMPTKKAL